jgi:hypothetical protein
MKTKTILGFSIGILTTVVAAPSRLGLEELRKVDFASECTTSSDPASRLFYEHEDMVSNFLNVPGRFGLSRMIPMIYGHEHLATHRGTNSQPRTWTEGQWHYKLDEWGLTGDLGEAKAKVYFLKPQSFFYNRKTDGQTVVPKAEHISSREVDPFEAYALAQLKKGEKLVRWERADFVRAMGAVRAEAICLKCHEVKEGDLLGAFVYAFTKEKAEPADQPLQALLKAALEGRSLEELGRDSLKDKNKVWSDLLGLGVITGEMLSLQAESRKQALETVANNLNKPKTASAEPPIKLEAASNGKLK